MYSPYAKVLVEMSVRHLRNTTLQHKFIIIQPPQVGYSSKLNYKVSRYLQSHLQSEKRIKWKYMLSTLYTTPWHQ